MSLCLAVPNASAASNPVEAEGLGLPLACTLGETCWAANYVDMDPSAEAQDFRCGKRTYNGHDGTDFAIRDLAVMAKGVPVVASAPGVVKNVRDGMEDVALTDAASRARIKGKECGNGVLVEHGEGWETQYCHLRKGSVVVRANERVQAGQQLGLVGLSGQTEFPHAHLTVRHNGLAVDPFTGRTVGSGCGFAGTMLWRTSAPVPYEEVALYNAGFASSKPSVEMIRSGLREDGPFPATAPALVLWVDLFGVQAGDRLRFRITGPDGKAVLEEEEQIEKTQARRFVYVGKRRKDKSWTTGAYTGLVTLTRAAEGKELSREVTRTVAVR
ncbi:MAG: M23 family metallopeptidase [Nitrospirota bacterium]